MLMAGAFAPCTKITVAYTNERRQFGKAVASFQAVQQHLVTATQSAVQGADGGRHRRASRRREGAVGSRSRRLASSSTTRSRSAPRAAHQAHGAMGVTREYPLHQLTRRLWSWRHEWGTTHSGGARSVRVVAAGADGLFELISE